MQIAKPGYYVFRLLLQRWDIVRTMASVLTTLGAGRKLQYDFIERQGLSAHIGAITFLSNLVFDPLGVLWPHCGTMGP